MMQGYLVADDGEDMSLKCGAYSHCDLIVYMYIKSKALNAFLSLREKKIIRSH